MADSDDGKKEGKSAGGRWWEFYFVRYALGTVFGVLIVDFLVKNGMAIPFPEGTVKEITKPEGVALLIAYGLAFCYLASSPLLLFHATRFAMRRRGIRASTVVFLVLGVGIMLVWDWFLPAKSVALGLRVAADITIFLITLLMLLQFRSLFVGEKFAPEMWEFYLKLDKNRRVVANRELIDSYRHLREHGNAFAVVLLEMLLGLGLYLSTKLSVIPPGIIPACGSSELACDPTSSTATIQSFVLLLFWIIPGAAVWSIGCYLESQFANDSTIGESGPIGSPPAPTPQAISTASINGSVPAPSALPSLTPVTTGIGTPAPSP